VCERRRFICVHGCCERLFVRCWKEQWIKYILYPTGRQVPSRSWPRRPNSGSASATFAVIVPRLKSAGPNLRENVLCARCGSTNRQRQLALVLSRHLTKVLRRRIRSLRDLPRDSNLHIYNTESRGAVHDTLVLQKGYYFSEYFGPGIAVGSR